MSNHPSLLEPEEVVLPTMNKDGSRHWIRPRLSKGKYYWWRLVVGWLLIIVFLAIPHLHINNKPIILLDLLHRQFFLFGQTFLATDAALLLPLMLGIFLGIFLFTAMFGRVWCGWGCPQTVYMELLFRPLERLIEGPPQRQRQLDRDGADFRRVLKYIVFFLISIILGNTFLAYFVDARQLFQWVQRSPIEHPTAFLVMLGTTCAVFFDFAYFREQTCLVACPYGRFQSALLDRNSLIVAYDYKRGEARGKAAQRKKGGPPTETGKEEWGDCIDCGACVVTCPTGIDIRNGLQMECVNCTQCIDACDAIMEKINKPKGLIRYSSQEQLEGNTKQLFRVRTIVYTLLITLAFGVLSFVLFRRSTAEAMFLRNGSAPFNVLQDGTISNQISLQINNRTHQKRRYHILLEAPKGVRMIAPLNPLPVDASGTNTSVFFVVAPSRLFVEGKLVVKFTVDDKSGFVKQSQYRLLGPESAENPPLRRK